MPDEVNGDMMQIMLSDFVPDSASFVFRESGKMTAFLKDKVPTITPLPSERGTLKKFELLVSQRSLVLPFTGPAQLVAHPPQHQ
jgi:hypothetical protein